MLRTGLTRWCFLARTKVMAIIPANRIIRVGGSSGPANIQIEGVDGDGNILIGDIRPTVGGVPVDSFAITIGDIGSPTLFKIYGNDFLTSVVGFGEATTSINLNVQGCDQLASLPDLMFVVNATGDGIQINGLAALTVFPEFDSLQSCSAFVVSDCPLLVSLPNLPSLLNLAYFQIAENNSLANVPLLQNLTSLSSAYIVQGCPALTTIAWPDLLSVLGGQLKILSNSSVTLLSQFDVLANVGGNFTITNNSALVSLPDFTALADIGGDLFLGLNGAANNLIMGFNNLMNVAGTINLGDNDDDVPDTATLASITGFNSLSVLRGNFYCHGAALDAASVNHILALLVNCTTDGIAAWANTVWLNGGASAAPTGQGIADKATLVGRGATVLTN